MPIVLDYALAWGPSKPSGSKWVTEFSCTFEADSSGLYGYDQIYYEIENNGWNTSGYYGNRFFPVTLQKESPTSNSRWRVQFRKWDGVDSYGNPYGYGEGWRIPYFNAADSCITIGLTILIITILFSKEKKTKKLL